MLTLILGCHLREVMEDEGRHEWDQHLVKGLLPSGPGTT